MDINVILENFGKLNDDNAMFVEFKNGGSLLVDNDDIIRANGDLIEIKATAGTYITKVDNVIGLKIVNRVDIVKKVLLGELVSEIGD